MCSVHSGLTQNFWAQWMVGGCRHEKRQAVVKWCYLELTELLYFGRRHYPPKLVLFFSSHVIITSELF